MPRIFFCASCGDPCILHVPEDEGVPKVCPYPGGTHDPEWREMVPAEVVD